MIEKINVINIESINILLMLFSLYLAYLFPFELFLFSYIILGPLHYMTELVWLKERDFFTRDKRINKTILMIGLFAIGLLFFIDIQDLINIDLLESSLRQIISSAIIILIFIAFAISFLIQLGLSSQLLWASALIVFGASLYLLDNVVFAMIFGLFIPTLIHTTIFTGTFILEGALKRNNTTAYISFVIFVLCNLFFFLWPSIEPKLLANTYVQNLFLESDFYYVNLNFRNIFFTPSNQAFVLDSVIGTRIQGFIAFAYTYHYLNWFSKTKIIKWNVVPQKYQILSISIWIGSIILHLINIKLGIIFISLLSMLHVFMEFPLNNRAFINVFTMLKSKILNYA